LDNPGSRHFRGKGNEFAVDRNGFEMNVEATAFLVWESRADLAPALGFRARVLLRRSVELFDGEDVEVSGGVLVQVLRLGMLTG